MSLDYSKDLRLYQEYILNKIILCHEMVLEKYLIVITIISHLLFCCVHEDKR